MMEFTTRDEKNGRVERKDDEKTKVFSTVGSVTGRVPDLARVAPFSVECGSWQRTKGEW